MGKTIMTNDKNVKNKQSKKKKENQNGNQMEVSVVKAEATGEMGVEEAIESLAMLNEPVADSKFYLINEVNHDEFLQKELS